MRGLKIPYWYLLLGPTLLFYLGIGVNAVVMGRNHGQMPVLWPGGCLAKSNWMGDYLHSCMTAKSRLKFLSDWINLLGMNIGVASPGDLVLWLGYYTKAKAFWAWVALVIRDHCKKD